MNNDFLQKVNEEISVEENARLTNPDKMELTAGIKAGLIDEILELHHEFGYDSTTYGVEEIVDTWWENKGRYMTQLFGNHPNYMPGKFQIVFDSDYNRRIDSVAVDEFLELRIIQFGRSGVEQREFEINSVDDLRVIRGGWRVFAKEKYDEGTVEYSAIEVNHIFTT